VPPCDFTVTVEPPEVLALVVQPPPALRVTLESAQGPSGPPGSSSVAFARVAEGALGGHRLVIATGSEGAAYASSDDPAHLARAIGVTTGAAVDGAPVFVQGAGYMVEPSWSWTPGGDLWLGLNGAITQSPPPSSVFVQCVGYALTPTEIWIELAEPITL